MKASEMAAVIAVKVGKTDVITLLQIESCLLDIMNQEYLRGLKEGAAITMDAAEKVFLPQPQNVIEEDMQNGIVYPGNEMTDDDGNFPHGLGI